MPSHYCVTWSFRSSLIWTGNRLYHTVRSCPDVSFSKGNSCSSWSGILGNHDLSILVFWQASVEVEEEEHRSVIVDKHVLAAVKADINYGMGFSGLVMYFIILSAGAILFPEGVGISTLWSRLPLH